MDEGLLVVELGEPVDCRAPSAVTGLVDLLSLVFVVEPTRGPTGWVGSGEVGVLAVSWLWVEVFAIGGALVAVAGRLTGLATSVAAADVSFSRTSAVDSTPTVDLWYWEDMDQV